MKRPPPDDLPEEVAQRYRAIMDRESRPVRPASVSRMSQLLLQGYAMLADSCPDCGVPLMRKPGGGGTLCVNCDPEAEPAENGGPALGNGISAHSDSEEEGAEPVVPRRGQAPVAASGEADEAAGLLSAPLPLSQRLQQGRSALASGHGASREDPVTQRIADKMLEGWALLDESCPRCQTPLVRDRQRRLYCVSCELFAVREADLQHAQQGGHAQQGTMPGAARAAAAEPGGPAGPAAVGGTVVGAQVAAGVPAPVAAAAAPPRNGTALGVRQGAAMVTGEPLLVQEQPPAQAAAGAGGEVTAGGLLYQLGKAAAAVGTKMEQASDELLAGASTQTAQELVQLVRSCAEALGSIEDCRSKLRAGS